MDREAGTDLFSPYYPSNFLGVSLLSIISCSLAIRSFALFLLLFDFKSTRKATNGEIAARIPVAAILLKVTTFLLDTYHHRMAAPLRSSLQ